jgi:hypothetical protein
MYTLLEYWRFEFQNSSVSVLMYKNGFNNIFKHQAIKFYVFQLKLAINSVHMLTINALVTKHSKNLDELNSKTQIILNIVVKKNYHVIFLVKLLCNVFFTHFLNVYCNRQCCRTKFIIILVGSVRISALAKIEIFTKIHLR